MPGGIARQRTKGRKGPLVPGAEADEAEEKKGGSAMSFDKFLKGLGATQNRGALGKPLYMGNYRQRRDQIVAKVGEPDSIENPQPELIIMKFNVGEGVAEVRGVVEEDNTLEYLSIELVRKS